MNEFLRYCCALFAAWCLEPPSDIYSFKLDETTWGCWMAAGALFLLSRYGVMKLFEDAFVPPVMAAFLTFRLVVLLPPVLDVVFADCYWEVETGFAPPELTPCR